MNDFLSIKQVVKNNLKNNLDFVLLPPVLKTAEPFALLFIIQIENDLSYFLHY